MRCRVLSLSVFLVVQGVAAQSPVVADEFSVESPDLKNGVFTQKFVARGFGCNGENVSPEIKWNNPPVGTKSFALVVHDPDAPTGIGGFTHWMVVNIPASARGLPQGAGNGKLPAPAVGVSNGFDNTGVTGLNGHYGGPCPPQGNISHRYVFSVYALAVEDIYAVSGIPLTASSQVHGFVLNKGIDKALLGKVSFTAKYGR